MVRSLSLKEATSVPETELLLVEEVLDELSLEDVEEVEDVLPMFH